MHHCQMDKKFHPIIEYVDTSEVFGLPLITKTSMF